MVVGVGLSFCVDLFPAPPTGLAALFGLLLLLRCCCAELFLPPPVVLLEVGFEPFLAEVFLVDGFLSSVSAVVVVNDGTTPSAACLAGIIAVELVRHATSNARSDAVALASALLNALSMAWMSR